MKLGSHPQGWDSCAENAGGYLPQEQVNRRFLKEISE